MGEARCAAPVPCYFLFSAAPCFSACCLQASHAPAPL